MKRVIAIALILIFTFGAVSVTASSENGISISDAETIPGGIVELSIYADFKELVRSMVVEVRYPSAFEYAGLFPGSLLYEYDPVELTIDNCVGSIEAMIEVDCSGITGVGQLLKLHLYVPSDYPAESVAVAVDVITPDDYDSAMSYITVRQPTATDVLNLMRWTLFGQPEVEPWMDVNGDGDYTAVDALLIFRKVLNLE